ncbi:MAG: hypothetical protein HGB19_08490 [Chlorobiales bacterium]|jgi:hypothetical protein|nr:hypothetical protein [Chlorobiales bacterium]
MIPAIRYIAVLMLIGMFLQINCVCVYYGLFSLNQKAIAESVCEKKTMDCSGRCYLQKKIDVSTDSHPATSERQPSTKTLEDLLNTMPGLLPDDQLSQLTSSIGNRFDSGAASFLPDGVTRLIDHPPNA